HRRRCHGQRNSGGLARRCVQKHLPSGLERDHLTIGTRNAAKARRDRHARPRQNRPAAYPPRKFRDRFLCTVDLERRQVELVDCGHMPVIHYQHHTGSCATLQGSHVPLGVSEGEIYEEFTQPFEPEDVFVFYSDGITEAQNSSGEFFGLSRLAECVRLNGRLDAWQLITKIRTSVVAFSNSETFADDLTCVVVKIE